MDTKPLSETEFLDTIQIRKPHVPVQVTTRNSATVNRFTMSEQKKQERDFTPEVDALLPEVEALVKVSGKYWRRDL